VRFTITTPEADGVIVPNTAALGKSYIKLE
jgi:hypothetical protein